MVNFSVTRAQLVELLVAVALRAENPELEQEHVILSRQKAKVCVCRPRGGRAGGGREVNSGCGVLQPGLVEQASRVLLAAGMHVITNAHDGESSDASMQ